MKNTEKNQSKRVLYAALLVVSGIMLFAVCNSASAQCKPMIKIDGKATVVNENDDFGLTLPFWLKAGQTLAVGSSVASISVIEFDVDINKDLKFSQVLNITSTTGETVPANTVWKIESTAKTNNSSTYKTSVFSAAGTYTWKVPACAEEICIDMWGAGGGGGSGTYSNSFGYYLSGGGGGGGSYGSQCFAVTPGDSYTIIVGAGGLGGYSNGQNINGNPGATGGTSSVTGTGISMTANGGSGGTGATTSAPGTGGAGGTSSAASNAQGANGNNGGANTFNITLGSGGAGANGGAGGAGVTASGQNGNPGTNPGGAGSGGSHYNTAYYGGPGAAGKVIISW